MSYDGNGETWGPVPRELGARYRAATVVLEWPWTARDPTTEPGEGSRPATQTEYAAVWCALETCLRRWVSPARRFGLAAFDGPRWRRMVADAGGRSLSRREPRSMAEWAEEYWRARRWLLGSAGGRSVAGGLSFRWCVDRLGLDSRKLARVIRRAAL